MKISVSDARDFYRVLAPAYTRLLAKPLPDTLEVTLATGDFRQETLDLTDRRERGHVALSVRGADPADPTHLMELNIKLVGRAVYVENVVVRDVAAEAPLVYVGVWEDMMFANCAFLANHNPAWPSGVPLLEISARPPTYQVATFRDCWFIANRQESPATMLKLQTMAQQPFDHIVLENVAFLNNDFTIAIRPGAAQRVTLLNCFVHSSQLFLAVEYLGCRVEIIDSVVMGPSLEKLFPVAFQHSEPIVHIKNTHLFLEEKPDNYRRYMLDKTWTGAAPLLQPDDLAAICQHYAALASAGVKPDVETLATTFGLL